jgi:ABC-type Zn uptake system ZnuABC Zn-binding protein ZnuA
MSPLNVIKWVETITEQLIRISPENSDYFKTNSKSYIQELNNLHNDILQKLSAIEIEKRVMVTDHDSFRYFARDYQFTVTGTIIPGFSSNNETSAKALSELITIIEKEKTPAIFIGETAGNDIIKLSENIRKESGSTIKIIPLKTGTLDPPGNGQDTYIQFMTYNVDQIIKGLSE